VTSLATKDTTDSQRAQRNSSLRETIFSFAGSHISFLSTRARFILAKYQLDNFENFFRFFVIEGKRMNFYSIKEWGDKAVAELTSLVRAAAGTNRRSIARRSKTRARIKFQ
jgi:hypothetical protein